MFSLAKAFPTPAPFPQWWVNLWSGVTRTVARTQPRCAPESAAAHNTLALQIAPAPGQTDIAHVQVLGELDRFTYTTLIDQAVALHTQGYRSLLLDLRQTQRIELSGLFALISIARLYSGQGLLDPAGGWAALRSAAEECTPVLGQRVKLLATPTVLLTIRNASFCDVFEIYDEVISAVAAFTG